MASHRIFDPERIRALAHPTRLDLLDYLRDVPEATATQCAEQVGESVAGCSFHLRILGKYGYIERCEQRGREKPWRAVAGDRWDMRASADEPESRSAVAELAGLTVVREGQRVQRFLSQFERENQQWADSAAVMTSSLWLNAEEMTRLNEQILTLLDPYTGRDTDPSLRPQDARKSWLFATLNPDPAPKHE